MLNVAIVPCREQSPKAKKSFQVPPVPDPSLPRPPLQESDLLLAQKKRPPLQSDLGLAASKLGPLLGWQESGPPVQATNTETHSPLPFPPPHPASAPGLCLNNFRHPLRSRPLSRLLLLQYAFTSESPFHLHLRTLDLFAFAPYPPRTGHSTCFPIERGIHSIESRDPHAHLFGLIGSSSAPHRPRPSLFRKSPSCIYACIPPAKVV